MLRGCKYDKRLKQFKKGHIPWNKGITLQGVLRPVVRKKEEIFLRNRTELNKRYVQWRKTATIPKSTCIHESGKSRAVVRGKDDLRYRTDFKKGHMFWRKAKPDDDSRFTPESGQVCVVVGTDGEVIHKTDPIYPTSSRKSCAVISKKRTELKATLRKTITDQDHSDALELGEIRPVVRQKHEFFNTKSKKRQICGETNSVQDCRDNSESGQLRYVLRQKDDLISKTNLKKGDISCSEVITIEDPEEAPEIKTTAPCCDQQMWEIIFEKCFGKNSPKLTRTRTSSKSTSTQTQA